MKKAIERADDHLSDDGKSLVVGGLKWFPKNDMLFLNIGDLNFAKRQRGKNSTGKVNVISEKLTKRDCVSKSTIFLEESHLLQPPLN